MAQASADVHVGLARRATPLPGPPDIPAMSLDSRSPFNVTNDLAVSIRALQPE